MKELSLNILDITENSVKAGSTLTEITLCEEGDCLTLTINDNGCGMDEETARNVIDPFYTTRTTRSVGMGVPLLKLAAEQTGGTIKIVSSTDQSNHGTSVTATFNTNHLDFTPLGDVVSTVTTLIQGHSDVDFVFVHKLEDKEVSLDTRQLREILEDVPLNSYEVIKWVRDFLIEQYNS